MIERLDHLVITVHDVEATCAFYERVLGMRVITFGEGRKALHFGNQKINLHPIQNEIEPKALHYTPGSADLCFITTLPLEEYIRHLENCGVAIKQGPVTRTGAMGKIQSVYFNDLDGNLIEVSTYSENVNTF